MEKLLRLNLIIDSKFYLSLVHQQQEQLVVLQLWQRDLLLVAHVPSLLVLPLLHSLPQLRLP
jgi:hypothetical protein